MCKRNATMGSCALGLAATLGAAPAHAQGWSFSAGADYSVGDYGLSEDTTIFETPFTASFVGDRWGVSLTAPYVKVEGPGGVAPGGLGGGGLFGGLLGPTQTAITPQAGHVEEQGWGDVTASASVTPIETDGGTSISLIGGVSAPTGDESRSLGAGEASAALSTALRKRFDNRASFYGAVGYERAFESEADGLFATAGAETYLFDHVLFGGRLSWAEASAALRRDAAQAGLYAGVDVAEHARLVAYGAAGLSDTSPHSAGVALVLGGR